MLRIVLTIIQVFSCLAIIGLVLLQRGKGADAGAGFGAGASGTVFGARGASTALSRATAIFAAIFMVNSLLMTYVGTKTAEQPKTILDVAGESATKPQPAGSAQGAPATAPAPANAPASAPSPATAPAQAPSAPTGTQGQTPK